MNKKAIAILGVIFILIVGTLGFLIYLKYSNSKKATTPAPVNQTNTASTTPTDPSQPNIPTSTPSIQKVVSLTTDQILSPTLFYNGTGITYFDHQSSLFQATLQDESGKLQLTSKKNLSIPIKGGIAKILWPPKGNDFNAVIQTGTSTLLSYYNSQTGSYTDLPPQIISLDWMPTGDKIMYIWLQDGKSTLNISNPDGSNWKKITDMWELDDTLSVSPDGRSVLYYRTGNTDPINPIVLTTPDGKTFDTKVSTGYNMGVLWSPDSQKFLFGKRDPNTQNLQLWSESIATGEIKNLGLFTRTTKAVWDKDSQTVYAAVANVATNSANNLTVDTVYKIDTSSLTKTQYDLSPVSADVEDLFLSATSDKLFFRNAQDGGLYYLNLTQ